MERLVNLLPIFVPLLCLNSVIALQLEDCHHALGMQSEVIKDRALSASSSHDLASTGPQNARLNANDGAGAWCPQRQINPETKEWLQIEFDHDVVVTGLATQGRHANGEGAEFAPFYSLEYIRPSMRSWAVYKDDTGNMLIAGNNDTCSLAVRRLDRGVIAKKIRIIPHSEYTRTVCLRLEVYGCQYKEPLAAYSMPEGSSYGGYVLKDDTYDGHLGESNKLLEGFGKLFDGKVGKDIATKSDFSRWVGWHRDSQGPSVRLTLKLATWLRVTSVSVHVLNRRSMGARVFEKVLVFSSDNRETLFDASTDGEIWQTVKSENSTATEWVRIPLKLKVRKTRYIGLEFQLADFWLIISEIQLLSSDSAPVHDIRYLSVRPYTRTETVTYFTVDDVPSSYVSLMIVIGVTMVGLFSLLICQLYLRYRRLHQAATVFAAHMSTLERDGPKDVQIYVDPMDGDNKLPLAGATKVRTLTKAYGSSSYRMAADNMENSLLEKLPKTSPPCTYAGQRLGRSWGTTNRTPAPAASPSAPSTHSNSNGDSSSSEYAEPDLPDMLRSMAALPLLPPSPNNSTDSGSDQMHYASNNIIGTGGYHLDQAQPCTSTTTTFISGGGNLADLVSIPRESLSFKQRLGEGEFGEVHLCQLEHRLVAVKTLRQGASDQAKVDFEHEMRTLSRLRHNNIVEVIGQCASSDGTGACCIVEYMANGDLNQYLRGEHGRTIEPEMLISICTQVAAGMSYLESQNFVHRDLAARNCLVADDGSTVKISDFGMSRSLYSSDYYRIEGAFILPIRWMAWECLLMGKFTSKSDVWAFGVTMWEVMNRCVIQPFANLTDDQVIENIQRVHHNDQQAEYLSQPTGCDVELYALMRDCWLRNSEERPTFHEIHLFLQRRNLSFAR